MPGKRKLNEVGCGIGIGGSTVLTVFNMYLLRQARWLSQ